MKCRSKELDLIKSLYSAVFPPALYIHGPTATGKTSLIKHYIEDKSQHFIYIDCSLCYSINIFFQSVQDHFETNVKVSSFNDLVNLLNDEVKSSVVLVVDHCERLQNISSNIVLLLRLHEFTNAKISVILIGRCDFDLYLCNQGISIPIILYFPPYTKEEILELLISNPPSEDYKELYNIYCDLFLGVFYFVCNNIDELFYLSQTNFANFIAPVLNGEVSSKDQRKLWRLFEPKLRQSLKNVYLRECTFADLPGCTSNFLELPVISKWLLLSGFFASFNPPSSDRRFFSKSGRAKSNSRNTGLKKLRTGPKYFPLDRLLAIFSYIADCKVELTLTFLAQISSLVNLGLFAKQFLKADVLDNCRYICLADYSLVQYVGKNLGVDINDYLYHV